MTPWNKGLTMATDSRVVSSAKKIQVPKNKVDEIEYLFKLGRPQKDISIQTGITIRVIQRILKELELERSFSELRVIVCRDKLTYMHDQYITLNGKNVYLLEGAFNNEGKLLERGSLLVLKCEDCKSSFERDYFGFKSGIKHSNAILCRKCAIKRAREKRESCLSSSQQDTIGKMTGGIVNYRISKMLVDIALPETGVIIEYDGWHWHKDFRVRDENRNKYLISLGWKVLRIKSARMLPTENELFESLGLLEKTDTSYHEIILPDWGGYTS